MTKWVIRRKRAEESWTMLLDRSSSCWQEDDNMSGSKSHQTVALLSLVLSLTFTHTNTFRELWYFTKLKLLSSELLVVGWGFWWGRWEDRKRMMIKDHQSFGDARKQVRKLLIRKGSLLLTLSLPPSCPVSLAFRHWVSVDRTVTTTFPP